jgi:hypothetical protein
MDFKRESNSSKNRQYREFAEPLDRKPLELLRDTEKLIRRPTVDTLVPILPQPLANRFQSASELAEDSLAQLAEIDLDEITDWELQPARVLVGLSFVGFGALAIALLLLYLYTLHPQLNPVDLRKYWHLYVWFVCLGVAGMFVLGREAMRLDVQERLNKQKSSSGRS